MQILPILQELYTPAYNFRTEKNEETKADSDLRKPQGWLESVVFEAFAVLFLRSNELFWVACLQVQAYQSTRYASMSVLQVSFDHLIRVNFSFGPQIAWVAMQIERQFLLSCFPAWCASLSGNYLVRQKHILVLPRFLS